MSYKKYRELLFSVLSDTTDYIVEVFKGQRQLILVSEHYVFNVDTPISILIESEHKITVFNHDQALFDIEQEYDANAAFRYFRKEVELDKKLKGNKVSEYTNINSFLFQHYVRLLDQALYDDGIYSVNALEPIKLHIIAKKQERSYKFFKEA